MRVGFDSIVVPPAASGQAIALYNLLKDISDVSFFFISPNPYDVDRPTDATHRLSVPYRRVHRAPMQIENALLRLYSRAWRIPLHLYLKFITWQVERILRQEKTEAIIACTADLFEPYAAHQAAQSMGIPFILYAFDDYISQWTNPQARIFSEEYGPILIKEAGSIIVPNEFLQSRYQDRHGVQPWIIHNPIDLRPYQTGKPTDLDRKKDELNIVYTGAIYEAHYSAFTNLLRAMEMISEPNVRLHLYSEVPKERLQENGIDGPVVFHQARNLSEMARIQMQSDILFLPLAFSSKFPDDIMRTASPMKMGEYLAAGVPILVHAPSDSYVAWYFTHHKCGIVVDSDDPASLADAIRDLHRNTSLRNDIVNNARERAREDFSIEVAQDQLKRILKIRA